MNRGIGRVGLAITVLVLVLIGQLTYLQIVDAHHLANDPRNVRAALRDANRPRGDILTADGEVVARSVRSTDATQFEYQRQYPLGSLFAQVSGYQSFVFGNTGVEKTYNSPLVGRDTALQLQNLRDVLSGKQATGNVVLSLRADLQRLAVDQLGSQRGSVIVLDVRTGGIVAMYSNPSFDPSPLASHDPKVQQAYFDALRNDPANPALPRAYRERYPPGSTFKAVTASVAIEDGVATPATQFPVRRELDLPLTDQTLKNFGGQACGGTLLESFVKSCNTTFGQLGLELGNRFPPGMDAFGVYDAPPIDLDPGAAASAGPPEGGFVTGAPLYAYAGIGQGDVFTTPLQMALVAEAVATGGTVLAPHVGAEIRDADDRLVRRIGTKQWKRAMSPQTAATMTEMMVQVVERGTGTAAQIPGVAVAGKTGTAQHEGGAPHAWFIGFAPAATPQYAVAVLVENGGSVGSEATGGRIAAPIGAAMLAAALGT